MPKRKGIVAKKDYDAVRLALKGIVAKKDYDAIMLASKALDQLQRKLLTPKLNLKIMPVTYYTERTGVIAKKDYDAVRIELEALQRRHHKLTPKIVLAEARSNAQSVLRRYISLDKVEESAVKWWLSQAQDIIQSFWVYVEEQPELGPVRAWVSVAEVREDQRKINYSYVRVEEALTDDRYREQVLQKALAELKAWEERYASLRNYCAYFDQVHRAVGRYLHKKRT